MHLQPQTGCSLPPLEIPRFPRRSAAVFAMVFKAAAENDKYSRLLQSSAGVAVFVSERDDKDHWVRAGRACQRFALQATALGLKHAFVNQPVEVASLRPELAALVGMTGRRPDLVMRFGYGCASVLGTQTGGRCPGLRRCPWSVVSRRSACTDRRPTPWRGRFSDYRRHNGASASLCGRGQLGNRRDGKRLLAGPHRALGETRRWPVARMTFACSAEIIDHERSDTLSGSSSGQALAGCRLPSRSTGDEWEAQPLRHYTNEFGYAAPCASGVTSASTLCGTIPCGIRVHPPAGYCGGITNPI